MSEVITLLQDLVRIPSLNPAATGREESSAEAPLTDFIEQWLREAELPVVRQEVSPGRDNLLVVLPGEVPGVLLEAHLDTVGVAAMSGDPFSGELRDGKVWGRGACDDKASVAAMLGATRRLARERPDRALTLALVVDEEYGFTGIERLLAGQLPQPVTGAVVGEPTGLDVIDRHGGAVRLSFTVHGRAAHSAYPQNGDNAIYHAARLVQALEWHHKELQARDAQAECPRTCSVTRIAGGEALNIIPDRCVVGVDRRLAPGEHPEEVRAELTALAAEAAEGRFTFETESLLLDPPLTPRATSPLADRAEQILVWITGQSRRRAVSYSTDASNLALTGLEAIVLGPGDIAQAHAAEEWVEVEQVEQAAEVYFRLAGGMS